MEDILKEILYELKKINNKLCEGDTDIKVSISNDAICEYVEIDNVKVIKSIKAINDRATRDLHVFI